MRIMIIILLLGLSPRMAAAEKDLCRSVLPSLDNINAKQVEQLYDFKQKNQNSWKKTERIDGISYTLEPTSKAIYKLSWKIKEKLKKARLVGNLECEIPEKWKLNIEAPINIVYPPSIHGSHEESLYHQIDTVAGIYLGKSKYSLHPDIVSLIWHLMPVQSSAQIVDKIIYLYPFIAREQLTTKNDNLGYSSQLQLVALNFSKHSKLDQGDQLWLITNAQNQQAIRENRFATETSPHNGWLPWHNEDLPEFSAKSAQEAYKTTVVAPVEIGEIFNRALGQFVPDPVAVTDKMQAVYDIIAPLVKSLVAGQSSLFAHLVLQNGLAYELLTFELLSNGDIRPQSMEHIIDPSQIGLPSARSLGFVNP